MVSTLLQVFLPLATAIRFGHPQDVGGLDLDAVFNNADPIEVKGNTGEALLKDQVVAEGNLNRMDEEIIGWQTWIRVGNKVFHLLKQSDAEERQMNGRIQILKKRDNFNMDGKIRILKKRDNYNMDGKIRILKKRDNYYMEDIENNYIRIQKK